MSQSLNKDPKICYNFEGLCDEERCYCDSFVEKVNKELKTQKIKIKILKISFIILVIYSLIVLISIL